MVFGVPLLRGAGLAKQLTLGGTMVIGRAPDCDIVVQSRSVSGRHAAIELVSTGDAVIHDLNSLNGTFVNDARLKAQRVSLSDGDTVRFGYDPATYRYEAAARDPNPAPAPADEPSTTDFRSIPAAGRPPPPPRDEWLPRAELASADGVAVVTSTSGMRAPQARPPPADPWQPHAPAEHVGRATDASAAPPMREADGGGNMQPHSMTAAAAESMNNRLVAEMDEQQYQQQPSAPQQYQQQQPSTPQQYQQQPSTQQQYQQQQPSTQQQYQQQPSAPQQYQQQPDSPLTEHVISGLKEHQESSDQQHSASAQQPAPAATLGRRPSAPQFAPAASDPPNPPTAPAARDVFGVTGVAPSGGPGGIPWDRPTPAPQEKPSGASGISAVTAEEWSALTATVHHTAKLVHSAGLGETPPALSVLQTKSAAAVQQLLQQAAGGISQLCGEGSSAGGKHYVRELRRRVSIITGELREREVSLGELMQHDWAQALSGAKGQTRNLQRMLLDKNRELEDAQKALVSKFVVAADRGSADEAQLHAFVTEQAREVSKAKSETCELERQNAELRDEAIRAGALGKQLALRVDSSAAAEQRREQQWALRIAQLDKQRTALNMKVTQFAAGGKQARKEAAEVLVAQIHSLEQQVQQSWQQQQDREAADGPLMSAAECAALRSQLHEVQAQLELDAACESSVKQLVELREGSAVVNCEVESLRRENLQLRGLLVARGGCELVDDSGPLSCLSEVISRRDETITDLKLQLSTTESEIAMRRVVEGLPGAQSVTQGFGFGGHPDSDRELAATDVVEEVPEERPWEGLQIPLLLDETEEGLFSMDSLDYQSYDQVAYDGPSDQSYDQSIGEQSSPHGDGENELNTGDFAPVDEPRVGDSSRRDSKPNDMLDGMSEPAEMSTIPDDYDDEMSEYEPSIDGDAA